MKNVYIYWLNHRLKSSLLFFLYIIEEPSMAEPFRLSMGSKPRVLSAHHKDSNHTLPLLFWFVWNQPHFACLFGKIEFKELFEQNKWSLTPFIPCFIFKELFKQNKWSLTPFISMFYLPNLFVWEKFNCNSLETKISTNIGNTFNVISNWNSKYYFHMLDK